MTRAQYSGSLAASYAYTYDAVGNRLTQNASGTLTTYGYDNANRLTSVNGQPYTWDNNGNLTSDGLLTYSYDQANRLKQATQGANTYTFAYNGVGDRLSQTVGVTTTHYVLDPAAGLTHVLADGTSTYLYGNGRLAQYQAAMQYFGADGLGGVRQLYDASGQVLANTRYDPYGSVVSQYGTATSVFGYTGEQYDAATGLEYLRARYYSPAQGRFLTRDVWAGDPNAPMSYNAWNYVSGNPVNYVDPTGLQGCTTEGICPPPPHPTPPLPPKTPTLPPDSTVPAGLMFAIYFQDYTARLDALQQALNDPHPLALFDLYPGQIETRDALLELWFDIHCDYDPLFDYRIEQWAEERGWDPYAFKLHIRYRYGLWKIQREPASLAGIQSLFAGAAPLGAEQQIDMMTGDMALAGVTAQGHHIATNRYWIKSPQWSAKFQRLFDKGGLSLDDAINIVDIPGHTGPHSEGYHQWTYDRLSGAIKGASGKAQIRAALEAELNKIGAEIRANPSLLNMP